MQADDIYTWKVERVSPNEIHGVLGVKDVNILLKVQGSGDLTLFTLTIFTLHSCLLTVCMLFDCVVIRFQYYIRTYSVQISEAIQSNF